MDCDRRLWQRSRSKPDDHNTGYATPVIDCPDDISVTLQPGVCSSTVTILNLLQRITVRPILLSPAYVQTIFHLQILTRSEPQPLHGLLQMIVEIPVRAVHRMSL